jgi:hypothetical protein
VGQLLNCREFCKREVGKGGEYESNETRIKECSAVTAVGVFIGLNPLVLLEN